MNLRWRASAPLRLFQEDDGAWYFRVRSGRLEGPFNNERTALRMLERHVLDCRHRRGWGPRWPRTWSPLRLLRRPPKAAPAKAL